MNIILFIKMLPNDAHLNRVHGLPQYLHVIHHDHHAHGLIHVRCDHHLRVNHLIYQGVDSMTERVTWKENGKNQKRNERTEEFSVEPKCEYNQQKLSCMGCH